MLFFQWILPSCTGDSWSLSWRKSDGWVGFDQACWEEGKKASVCGTAPLGTAWRDAQPCPRKIISGWASQCGSYGRCKSLHFGKRTVFFLGSSVKMWISLQDLFSLCPLLLMPSSKHWNEKLPSKHPREMKDHLLIWESRPSQAGPHIKLVM